MDVFQLIGDFLHLIAILLLLLKIIASKNVVGLSYKTQELYLVVFLTRYSDMILEHHWGSLYFNMMRFIFIFITAATIYYMRFKRPFKLVPPILISPTMRTPIPSRTTTFTLQPLCSESSCTAAGQSTASSRPSPGGLRPSPSSPSST